jgi:uncharacterized membrane protein
MTVFDDVATAMGNLIGSTPEAGGFILGLVTIIAVTIMASWSLGSSLKGMSRMFPTGIALALVSLIGWWPLWTIVLIGLFIAYAVFTRHQEADTLG